MTRAKKEGYNSKGIDELFLQNKEKKAAEDMNPKAIQIRESRDSEEHPFSFPIIYALDETGSMGKIPHKLLKEDIPHVMEEIFQAGIPHPQVLFMGVGDHYADRFPLQVGQFESNDELMDKWLKSLYLEAGGGRGDAESYHLVWYFAAHNTVHDSWEKRQQKGVLITMGDEPCHPLLEKGYIQRLSPNQADDYTLEELLAKARETYEVYHIHVAETRAGHNDRTKEFWKRLLGDNLRIAESYKDIPSITAQIVSEAYKGRREKVEVDTLTEIL